MGKHESIRAVRFVPSMSHSGSDYIGRSSSAIHEDKKKKRQFFVGITTIFMLFSESSQFHTVVFITCEWVSRWSFHVDSVIVFTADSALPVLLNQSQRIWSSPQAAHLFKCAVKKGNKFSHTQTQMCSSHCFKACSQQQQQQRRRPVWTISCCPLVARWAGTCTAAVWSEPVSSWLLPAPSPFSASPPGLQWSSKIKKKINKLI